VGQTDWLVRCTRVVELSAAGARPWVDERRAGARAGPCAVNSRSGSDDATVEPGVGRVLVAWRVGGSGYAGSDDDLHGPLYTPASSGKTSQLASTKPGLARSSEV
jgi:hypothetical protein